MDLEREFAVTVHGNKPTREIFLEFLKEHDILTARLSFDSIKPDGKHEPTLVDLLTERELKCIPFFAMIPFFFDEHLNNVKAIVRDTIRLLGGSEKCVVMVSIGPDEKLNNPMKAKYERRIRAAEGFAVRLVFISERLTESDIIHLFESVLDMPACIKKCRKEDL